MMNGALKKKTTSGEVDDSSQSNIKKFRISKEIVVLCPWKSESWKLVLLNELVKVELPSWTWKILESNAKEISNF